MEITAEELSILLDEMGIDAVVREYPNASFNPATNKTTLGAVVEHDVKIIPPYKNIEGFKNLELITSGDGWTGIANNDLDFTVKTGLIFIIYDVIWTVTGVTPISNKTGVLFYLMQIEKGN